MKVRISLATIAVLIAGALSAQDFSKVKLLWKVDTLVDLLTNERFVYSCTFESKGSNEIVWNQKDGFTSTISLKSATDAWSDVKAIGSVTYTAAYEEESGTITFERTESGYRIILLLGPGTKPNLHHLYLVSTITEHP